MLHVEGVVKFISFGYKIITVPEEQMYWLDRLISKTDIEYEDEFPMGANVEVEYGPFKGLRGRVKNTHSETRLVVWFDTIMQGVSVDIDPMYLSIK